MLFTARKQAAAAVNLLTTLCLLFVFANCGGGSEDTGPDPHEVDDAPAPIPNTRPVPTTATLNCPDGTSLTYENFGRAFMLENCTMCHASTLKAANRHGAPVGVDFDTARGVAIWNEAIFQQAASKTPKMPPAGSVTTGSRDLLAQWLQCGAPSAK